MWQAVSKGFAGQGQLAQKRARAFLYFSSAFGALLLSVLVVYAAFIPERLAIAGPPCVAGLISVLFSLLLLRKGKLELATNQFNALLAVVLIAAQFGKLRGDYHTAYSSFVFLFSLPVLSAGLFNRKRIIVVLSIVMMAANVIFFILLLRNVSGLSAVSARIGFVSSLLIQAIAGTLIYLTRQILDGTLDELRNLNASLNRFVPYEFLRQLNKETVTDLHLGDHKEAQMSVLFCDIRGFTSLTERLGAEATFRLLGAYFERIGPIIRGNHGYIDKYIGDAIMALFDSADEAVACARGMLVELERMNHAAAEPLQIGIGIGTGSIILGAIGEFQRIDNTAIGDSVNASARLEALTAKLRHPLIISGPTYDLLSDQSAFVRLGRTKVKGKSELITVYALAQTELTPIQ